jgi:hypothetical protein
MYTFDKTLRLLVVSGNLDDLPGEEVVWVEEVECPREVDGDLVLEGGHGVRVIRVWK